ncbi:hypothetical protein ASD12_11945 [Mesorhizobium sp. Root102]|uniref:helix-turn-helix transcriptional regulator n=1 Tax=Mesorhizobium sp. Root102 TaxID=1736422 RepID=UPI0006FD09AE|nr:AlpA family phage regulatory protein [Mesorhizobium sp. Root102]KQU80111.1 hypothetical protein ASD12_11945 [Mesorhizobium sp. Root102]
MSENYLRLPQVKAIIGLSRSTIYAMMDAGAFPRSYKLGKRSVGWRKTEIDDHNSRLPRNV